MKRIILGGVALVVAALGVAIFYFVSSLDSLVKSAIETYGSQAMGTAVRVSSVQIALTSGKGTIRGVTVANPRGFSSADAFRLGEITLQIDPASVKGRPVVVDQVVIRAPEVSYELDESGRSNIDVIRDHLRRYQGPEADERGAGEGGASSGEEVQLVVKRFTFEDGKLAANTEAVGGKSATVELPSLRLTGLGEPRGATGAEIGKTVMTAYSKKVLGTVAASQLDRVIDEKLGGETGEAAKKLLQRVFD